VVTILPKTNRQKSKINTESFAIGILTPERLFFFHRLATLLINPYSNMAADEALPGEGPHRIKNRAFTVTSGGDEGGILLVINEAFHHLDLAVSCRWRARNCANSLVDTPIKIKIIIQIVPLSKLGQNYLERFASGI
jgi:hypothetical protein